jgi:hypothetical protein
MALALLIAAATTLIQMVTQPRQERCWTDATL